MSRAGSAAGEHDLFSSHGHAGMPVGGGWGHPRRISPSPQGEDESEAWSPLGTGEASMPMRKQPPEHAVPDALMKDDCLLSNSLVTHEQNHEPKVKIPACPYSLTLAGIKRQIVTMVIIEA